MVIIKKDEPVSLDQQSYNHLKTFIDSGSDFFEVIAFFSEAGWAEKAKLLTPVGGSVESIVANKMYKVTIKKNG